MPRVAEEGSDKEGREGDSCTAVGRGRIVWEEVGKVSRVAEEGAGAGGREGCSGSAEGWGRIVWEEVR